jgi:hypothetical protein
MIHIHSRWLGVIGDIALKPTSDELMRPLTPEREERVNGGVIALFRAGGIADEVAENWLPGTSKQEHVVAVYQQDVQVSGATEINSIIGVASPFPVDTSHFLNQIRVTLQGRCTFVSLRAELTPESLSTLPGAKADSVSFSEKQETVIRQFNEPLYAKDLHGATPSIDAVTLILDGIATGRPVINLFSDNQFYVADPTPAMIRQVAIELARIWRT